MLTNMLMTLRTFRIAPFLLAGCLVFAGCADTTNMTPAQRAAEQSKRRFATTTAEGAIAGAVLGGLIGYATGGVKGAVIGAGAGGGLGAAAGMLVAQNNFQKTHSEANLNAAISDASAQANAARQDAANAEQIAADARAAAARLGTQYHSGQITLVQYRAGLASYQTSIATLQSISKGASEQAAEIRKSAALASGPKAASLDSSARQVDGARLVIDRAADSLRATLSSEPT